jgi:hypothetical protein
MGNLIFRKSFKKNVIYQELRQFFAIFGKQLPHFLPISDQINQSSSSVRMTLQEKATKSTKKRAWLV